MNIAKLNIIRCVSTDPELKRVVDQINKQIMTINDNLDGISGNFDTVLSAQNDLFTDIIDPMTVVIDNAKNVLLTSAGEAIVI